MTYELLNLICIVWMVIALATFILLQYVTAPYGRHVQHGWGVEIPNKLGWMLMESPSFLIMLYFFLANENSTYTSVLFALWLIHYFNRSFIYPFRIHTRDKKMPLAIPASAIFFNTINAGLNGYFLAYIGEYDISNFTNWHFVLGTFLFVIGFYINQKADTMLINLRKPDEKGYKIPRGFLFEYISCPNLFGEIVQWTGYALLAWNLPALTFWVWTLANLLPRALKHHQWYLEHFEEYPKGRKAVLPWVL